MTTSPLSIRRLAVIALLVGIMVRMLSAAEPVEQTVKATEAANATASPSRWEATIKNFEASDATTPPPNGAVLLVGGSNARRWTDVDDYFPEHQVINRGFGGARMRDVLYFADRIVLPYAPMTILVNAGGNDLRSGNSPEQIRDTARDLITRIHAALPEARIYFLGLPLVRRAKDAPEVRAAILAMNRRLAQLAGTNRKVEFIDLVPAFLDDDGEFQPDLFVRDGTHFSPKGYTVLSKLLRAKL